MKIKECMVNDRPRKKEIRFGIKTLSDQEIISLLLGIEPKNRDTIQIAQDLLKNGIICHKDLLIGPPNESNES